MTKKAVAAVLEEIAVLLELSGENPFKARSYTNVARALEQHEEDIDTLVREKRLRQIKGVGDALEQKIEELVTTGKLGYHEELRARFPESLFELFKIPGLGAKRIKTLYEDMKIETLVQLENACTRGTIAELKGFGDKMQQKILDGITFARRHQGMFHVHKALAEATRLRDWLTKETSVIRIEIAGSLRRRKEVIKDIDIVASSKKPEALMKRFVEAEGVDHITGHGETKSSVVLKSGIAADLRVVTDEEFPYALHHFTGSKDHNVAMRQRAKDRHLKMNEYGLFSGDTLVKCKDETAIFKKLGLPYIPPELREDLGELELEQTPRLVEQGDLVGLIHCHSTYSDGTATIEQMARAAKDRGYKYMVLADHSQTAAYAGGLVPAAVRKQHKEIDSINDKLKGFRVFKCIESDIRADGSLDYDDDLLKSFELIIASVHSGLTMTEAEATKRVVKAIENPYSAILGHLTGRLLLAREGYPLDMEKVVDACVRNRVAIEINANPHRLDMDWRHIRRARDQGAMFSIGPDAHSIEGIDDVQYGVGIARKGWLGPEHLINCMSAERLIAWRKGN
ncbi:MAG: DNA polymerase/3'-5' exonuclease PolX [Candidatus Hydrogenedentes bacterium]|nr:DNA polymerase/3'-5' exonuclease PolX [Candidatus Hydrogenedentota bacterium]